MQAEGLPAVGNVVITVGGCKIRLQSSGEGLGHLPRPLHWHRLILSAPNRNWPQAKTHSKLNLDPQAEGFPTGQSCPPLLQRGYIMTIPVDSTDALHMVRICAARIGIYKMQISASVRVCQLGGGMECATRQFSP